jgi:[protein-PII] uridylyltransferase
LTCSAGGRADEFADRPGKSAVERFMQFYFLQAKRVGSLTSVFLPHLEEEFRQTQPQRQFFSTASAQATRELKGFLVDAGRIRAPCDDWFSEDPVRLIELFQLAEAEGLEIHPQTMRQADRDSS